MTLKVLNYIDGAKLKADLAYSTTNMHDAYMQQASLFAHYAELSAKAARQVDNLELHLEAAESIVFRKVRDDAVAKGEKVTDEYAKRTVAANPTVRKIKMALNEAKQVAAVAKGAVEAFKQRRDMLIQHGADNREEFKGEVRLNALKAADDLKQRTIARLRAGASSD